MCNDVEMISLEIDGKNVSVPNGTTILEAANKVGSHIPTLCHHEDLCSAGLCRICVVEIEGWNNLQTSCTYPAESGMNINTTSNQIRKVRKDVVDLLMSDHYGDCITCKRSGNCELQEVAEEFGSDEFRFGRKNEPAYAIDDSGLSIVRDMDKCIQCRRCVRTCEEMQGVSALCIDGRSSQSEIAAFLKKDLSDTVCINCGQCINRCPTGALTEKDATKAVWKALDDSNKHVVIQTAPAPRSAIGECFGVEPGTSFTFEMNTALKEIGFDGVFDTNFSADLTIIEEGTELLTRLYKALVEKDDSIALPQFTSCSPGWIKYIEHFKPEYLDNLSTAKSPQQMFGAVMKTYYAEKNGIKPEDIVSVSLMPCTAKKFEAARPEMNDSGFQDVDYVLTTRELAMMVKDAGIDLPKLPKTNFDDPFGTATGSGVIFAATGGVMEAALRTVIELVVGIKVEDLFEHANILPVRGFDGARIAELTIPKVGDVPELLKGLVPNWNWLEGVTVKVGVAHGTINAEEVLKDIEDGGPFSECHFIEFMACPGGCIGGGGQPIPTNQDIRQKRADAIYNEDSSYDVRKSHENQDVALIYKEFLTDGPCGHKSHKLLHTDYTARGKIV